jgi:hypothetical protein
VPAAFLLLSFSQLRKKVAIKRKRQVKRSPWPA